MQRISANNPEAAKMFEGKSDAELVLKYPYFFPHYHSIINARTSTKSCVAEVPVIMEYNPTRRRLWSKFAR